MDHDSFFRNKVESMLITASWVEQVQKTLDIEGVSQVWGDRPEWYIWINHAPGVYALALEEGETIAAGNQILNVGQFTVKCYPYVTSGVLEAFSPQEQKIINSDVFDHTHTPRFKARPRIPESYFTVGSISFILDPAETVVMFTFDSLDLLKWSMLDLSPGQKNRPLKKHVIRNIPAWQIGYPLFDCLVSLYAYYSKQLPSFIGKTQSPGFECMIDTHQTPESRVCNDAQQWSTSVLFVDPADTDAWVDALWREHLETEEKIVFEHACSNSACNHTTGDGCASVDINPLWWNLAQSDYKSELSSICGCETHELHGCEAD